MMLLKTYSGLIARLNSPDAANVVPVFAQRQVAKDN